MHRVTSTLGVPAFARVIDHQPPDDLRAQSEEMRPVLALDPSCPNEFQIRLIGENGGLQGLTARTPGEVLPGDPAQLRVDQRDQVVEGSLVSVAPGYQ